MRAPEQAATPPLIKLRLAAAAVAVIAIVIAVGLARDTAFSLLERLFGLAFANFPIMLVSTIPARLVTACAYSLALIAALVFTRLLPYRLRFPVLCAIVIVGTFAAFRLMGGSARPFVFVAGAFVVNAAPRELLLGLYRRAPFSRIFDALFGLGVLVSEVLLPRPFLIWTDSKRLGLPAPAAHPPALRFVPAVVVGGVLMALFASYPAMARLSWLMMRTPQVDRFYGDSFGLYSRGDVASIYFDPATSRLFMCGNGLEDVMVISTANLHAPPIDTKIRTGGAQFCFADLAQRELLVVDGDINDLVLADLDTYATKRRIGPLNFGAGEGFAGKQAIGPLALVASEDAKREPSKPRMRLVNIETGQRLATSSLRAGYLFVHPTRPIGYISSYSDGFGVIAIDLPTLKVIAHDPGNSRLDRVTIDTARDEILVASPLHSRVLVYEAATLKPRGTISTQFGVRSMAVDPVRDLLVTASLVSRRVDVIDLRTSQQARDLRGRPMAARRSDRLALRAGLRLVAAWRLRGTVCTADARRIRVSGHPDLTALESLAPSGAGTGPLRRADATRRGADACTRLAIGARTDNRPAPAPALRGHPRG